ncbi:hypothetical protein ABH942_000393 [Flavobacterium sp. 28YEA47A]
MGQPVQAAPYFIKQKNMKPLFLKLLLLGFFSQAALAQEEENPGFDQYSSSVFNSKEETLYVVSSMNPKQYANALFQKGDILVQQIGDYNLFNANLKANEVNVSVLQNGNDNAISLSKQANTITQNIVQSGKNNGIQDFTYYTKYDVNTHMIQQGNNQNIQNYGTNSLSKDMKVTQSGNGSSVIILNQ